MLRPKFSAEAAADIVAAFSYYHSISPELAQAFEDRLETALTLLRQRPFLGSLRYSHLFPNSAVRAWLINRFPYQIIYKVESESLFVFRVVHVRKDLRDK